MTKNQIAYLKLLGYEDTQEDGAILEHPHLEPAHCYVWHDDKFVDVLEDFPALLVSATRRKIAFGVTHYVGTY